MFSRIFIVFAIDLSVIWLHPLSYFGAWTDSLGITYCSVVTRLLVLTIGIIIVVS